MGGQGLDFSRGGAVVGENGGLTVLDFRKNPSNPYIIEIEYDDPNGVNTDFVNLEDDFIQNQIASPQTTSNAWISDRLNIGVLDGNDDANYSLNVLGDTYLTGSTNNVLTLVAEDPELRFNMGSSGTRNAWMSFYQGATLRGEIGIRTNRFIVKSDSYPIDLIAPDDSQIIMSNGITSGASARYFIYDTSNYSLKYRGTTNNDDWYMDNTYQSYRGNTLLNAADVTDTPREALDVLGKVMINRSVASTGEELQVEGNTLFQGLVSQTGLGFSTYFGEGAGVNDDLANRSNTGFGFRALNSVVDSTSNVAIGYQTLSDGDSISSNVAIGYQTLKSLNNASSNTAVGVLSMSNKTGGNDNTAIGRGSQTNNLLASFNTSVGKESLEVVGNSGNTALGYRAARYLDNSQLNIAIGHSSLLTNITTPFLGYQNIALGTSAMRDAVDGSTQVYQNIAIGTESLRYSVGLNTVSIGYYAGREVVVGGNNTKSNNSLFLGALTKPQDINQTNQIVIGHLAEGKGSNTVTIGNDSITHTYAKGTINASQLSTYVDDAAAGVGGLVQGDIYMTATGELRIKL